MCVSVTCFPPGSMQNCVPCKKKGQIEKRLYVIRYTFSNDAQITVLKF